MVCVGFGPSGQVSGVPVRFLDQFMEGRRLLGMNHDAHRIQNLNQNSYSEGNTMKYRITSLIAIITFFGGASACSDAGESKADSGARDSQALTVTDADPEASAPGTTRSTTGGLTLGTATTPGPTIGSSSAGSSTNGATLRPESTSADADEKPGSTTLTPSPTVNGGEIRDVSGDDDGAGPIRWGSADAGVEVTLGAEPGAACASLREACLAAGESEATCDGLVAECEAAVAKPSAPQDQVGFVTDCEALGVSCREAGVPSAECERAVDVCKSPDAGAARPEAAIVMNCAELEETCELAALSETDCALVIAACEQPSTPTQPSSGLAADCAAVLATCLSYGLPRDECEEVEQECAEGVGSAGSNEIRLN